MGTIAIKRKSAMMGGPRFYERVSSSKSVDIGVIGTAVRGKEAHHDEKQQQQKEIFASNFAYFSEFIERNRIRENDKDSDVEIIASTGSSSRTCQICSHDYGRLVVPTLLSCCRKQICFECADNDRATKIAQLTGNKKKIGDMFCRQKFHYSEDTP